jgi:putative hydrolase of the HAD superfamily
MPLRAVFFDLDDTLCDTAGTREARARLAAERIHRELPELGVEEIVARVMEPAGDRIVRGIPGLVRELGLADTEAGREAVERWFFSGCMDLLKPLPGVVETLARLRERYLLGVITNGDPVLQHEKFLRLALDIPHVVISGRVGYEKPDPRIFYRALERAGTMPEESAFVGDRLDVDVAGAKAVGMKAVWFNRWDASVDGASPAPDAVIRRFGELLEVVEGLGRG